MKAIIKKIIDENETVKSFRLEPEKKPAYKAGQWTYIILPRLISPDERGPRRPFTLSSSPVEEDLQFTTRISESGFKQTLAVMREGETLEMGGVFGRFCLEEKETGPLLLLAGGIGITPFRSILKTIVVQHKNINVVLLYSVKNQADIIYAKELNEFDKSENIKVIIWETNNYGRINDEVIKKKCPDFSDRTTFVCGPPAMVVDLVETVVKMGVDGEQLKSEEMSGY